jgi:hypothetical protein
MNGIGRRRKSFGRQANAQLGARSHEWDRATLQKLWPPGQRAARSPIPYPNRIGKIASTSKPRTKSAPATRANEKAGAAYHSGQ